MRPRFAWVQDAARAAAARRRLTRIACACLCVLVSLVLMACDEGTAEGAVDALRDGASTLHGAVTSLGGQDDGTTDGPPYNQPAEVLLSPSSITSADATEYGIIDTSTANEGYVTVAVSNPERIKFLVTCGDMSYNYDVPGDGTPITCPLNMGDGWYTFRVMQNTSGNNYVELSSSGADVWMDNAFYPYLRPSTIVRYSATSDCVELATQLAADAQNEGDVVRAVSNYVISHVSYDNKKAEEVANVSGYLPNPDETLKTGKGICFDYAALGAAMLRSQGIPARVMTGYVSPQDVYHAWMMVYINGSWHNVQFNVNPDTWTRMDLTFASGGSVGLVGDGNEYTDRYTY